MNIFVGSDHLKNLRGWVGKYSGHPLGYLLTVGFGDWLASLTGESSLDASLYAGLPNSRISTNQPNLGFMVVVLGVYEIPQGNSHYILYVGSLIVLRSTLNQASVLPPANQPCIAQTALCSDICSCKP